MEAKEASSKESISKEEKNRRIEYMETSEKTISAKMRDLYKEYSDVAEIELTKIKRDDNSKEIVETNSVITSYFIEETQGKRLYRVLERSWRDAFDDPIVEITEVNPVSDDPSVFKTSGNCNTKLQIELDGLASFIPPKGSKFINADNFGKVYDNHIFGNPSWSKDLDKVVFIAEKNQIPTNFVKGGNPVLNTIEAIEEYMDLGNFKYFYNLEQGIQKPDFGEGLTDINYPVIVIIDRNKSTSEVIDIRTLEDQLDLDESKILVFYTFSFSWDIPSLPNLWWKWRRNNFYGLSIWSI